MADLTCPKCHGAMRTYERNGVHVDQCTECRGLFLDRGELEKLIDAENAYYEAAPGTATPTGGAAGETPSAPPAPSAGQPPHGQPAAPQHGQQPAAAAGAAGGIGAVVGEVLRQAQQARTSGHHGYGGYPPGYGYGYPRKRKKSFLDELFG